MTVWAKLQSWLGASASDVAIDNEFNNIYLGLNEAANGNLPSGYNKVDLTFTAASLTIKGETKMGNINVPLDSTLTVSGAAGWRYIVTTNGGVMSVESIPVAEIVADTQVYTPKPVFNTSANGYYSTVNTTRRIVGVCYFDATNIKEVIFYGSGKNKRDGKLYGHSVANPNGVLVNDRLEVTTGLIYSRGDISLVNNGAGTTPNEGMRIINGADIPITIFGDIYAVIPPAQAFNISLQKNGIEDVYIDVVAHNNQLLTQIIPIFNFTYTDINSKAGDFYQLYISGILVATISIKTIGANHVSI